MLRKLLSAPSSPTFCARYERVSKPNKIARRKSRLRIAACVSAFSTSVVLEVASNVPRLKLNVTLNVAPPGSDHVTPSGYAAKTSL